MILISGVLLPVVRYESTRFDTQGNKVELVADEINDDEQVLISPWQVKKRLRPFTAKHKRKILRFG